MQYFQVFLFVVIQVIPGASVVVYLPFVRATINTSAEFSKEHVFILLNQIILLDEFPRGRVGRPKNMRIIMDFSLFCNIAFAKKKKKPVWQVTLATAAYECTHFPVLCSLIKILM